MTGNVTGKVRTLLQLEGMMVLVVSVWAYARFGASWTICNLLTCPGSFVVGIHTWPKGGRSGVQQRAFLYRPTGLSWGGGMPERAHRASGGTDLVDSYRA
jgi:hypothetical protein